MSKKTEPYCLKSEILTIECEVGVEGVANGDKDIFVIRYCKSCNHVTDAWIKRGRCRSQCNIEIKYYGWKEFPINVFSYTVTEAGDHTVGNWIRLNTLLEVSGHSENYISAEFIGKVTK